MSRARLAAVSIAFIACGPRNAAPTTTAPSPVATASSAAPATIAPPAPFTHGADYTLEARVDRPSTKPLSSMPFFHASPKPGTYLLASGTHGSSIVSPAHPKGVALKENAYRAAWSPSGARVAITTEDGILAIYRADGALERSLEIAPCLGCESPIASHWMLEVAMPTEDRVRWHDSCHLRELDLGKTGSTPVDLATERCVTYVEVAANGERWILGEELPNHEAYGEGIWYQRLVSTGADGTSHVVVDESDVGHFTDYQISPDGTRACVILEGRKLACVTTDGKKTIDRISDARCNRYFTFDASSTRLFFQEEEKPNASLFVADFGARTIRRVITTPIAWDWFEAISADRALVYGIGGAKLVDLAAGWVMTVFDDPKDEVEGASGVPGDEKHFVIGKAAGPGRNLYWAEIPP